MVVMSWHRHISMRAAVLVCRDQWKCSSDNRINPDEDSRTYSSVWDNNRIGTGQAHNLAAIVREHATLKSLCGNKGDETALDISGKGMVADDAIMLAPEIISNGTLTSLNISSNALALCGLSKDWRGDTVGTYDASGMV